MIIYRATNLINNKFYIGKTKLTLPQRIKDHYYHLYDDTYFHRALKKYPAKNWKWEIIDTANSAEELNEKEIEWIEKLDAMNSDIAYNRAGGGEGYPTMDKINFDKARETRIKNHYTPEQLSNKEFKHVNRRITNRPVRCLDNNQVYINVTEAAKALLNPQTPFELDNDANAIRKCARGDTKTARKLHWEYLSEEEGREYSINAVCLIETGEIFRSIQQAAALKHQSETNIRACCYGEREDNAGYHWKWLNK